MGMSVRKSFRISEEDEQILREQCELYGMSDSAYFRFMLSRAKNLPEPVKTPKRDFLMLKELINEINHIGVNINQIVRNVNMKYYSDHEKRKLFALMEEILKKVANM